VADQEQTTIWIDANGRTRATYVSTGTGAADITDDLKALSSADVLRSWEGDVVENATPSPTTGTYQAVSDYAVLTFITTANTLVYLTLVAPLDTIFLSDQETVDSTAIAVLIADCIGNLQDQAGNAVSGYVSGIRRKAGREYQ